MADLLKSSSSASSSSSSSDEELFEEMDQEAQVILQALTLASNIEDYFNSNEMDSHGTVDHNIGVQDCLGSMLATPWFFKTLTNFTVDEFEELCTLVCPTIVSNARSTWLPHIVTGRPSKLSPEQRLMNFILYMKCDNVVTWDAFVWNWAKSSVCDDSFFVASCICQAIANEIRWPDAGEQMILGAQVPQFAGCIGFIDDTLIKIRRPKIEDHRVFFNGRKKMYSLNNIVIVDHNGLFIHVDLGYPGSYHDVNILRNSEFHLNWRRRIGTGEVVANADLAVVNAYNKMHAGFRIAVEWGIGGLKRKWCRLMKRYDCTRGKYIQLVHVAALLTNFLQRCCQVVGFEIIGEPHGPANDHGWLGDY